MQGVFLDRATLGDEAFDLSGLEGVLPGCRYYADTPADEVAKRIREAEVVITNKVGLNAVALEGARRLKLVCVAATGTNNVDLEAAHRLGIAVCNVAGYSTASVVQLVFAMILALYTHLHDYRQAVREGRWQDGGLFCLLDYPIRELAGKVMGIVGYGTLGRAVARVAEGFGMRLLVARRDDGPGQAGRLPLPALLPQVDVLTLHCPLTPATRGLIGEVELALMRPTTLLINTARGGIVDEAALAGALRRGALAGAGVDVLTREPPAAGNPLLAADIPNLIVTPHVGWASIEARQRLIDELARNVGAFLSGESRNRVV